MTTAFFQIAALEKINLKSGNRILFKTCSGTLTNWVGFSCRYGIYSWKSQAIKVANKTTTKEDGTKGTFEATFFFHSTISKRDKTAINIAPRDVCTYKSPKWSNAWCNVRILNNS